MIKKHGGMNTASQLREFTNLCLTRTVWTSKRFHEVSVEGGKLHTAPGCSMASTDHQVLRYRLPNPGLSAR